MNKKLLILLVLIVLIIPLELLLIKKMNWFKSDVDNKSQHVLIDTLNSVRLFDSKGEFVLQDIISDSVRIMFRFPPGTCSCLELEFSQTIENLKNMDRNRVFAVISVNNPEEVFFFKERNNLSYPIYSTTDMIYQLYDVTQKPYACIVFPDMTVRNTVFLNSENLNILIKEAKSCMFE